MTNPNNSTKTAAKIGIDQDKKAILDFYKSATTEELLREADRVCRKVHGDKVYLRGLVEFSNYCAKDCLYCGIRASNREVKRYRMLPDVLLKTLLEGFRAGLRTFVLQSGEDPKNTTEQLGRLVADFKDKTGGEAAVTLSCGLRSKADYLALKKAGADRYLMRFETSSPELFAKLKKGQTLERRLAALGDLKDLGYETGSGYLVGLPEETEEIRIQNALLSQTLNLDMVGIGPFIPHPATPLAHSPQQPMELTVRATALLRLLLPKAHIPATTAAGSLDPLGREKMLAAGANVLMPNITPVEHKQDYLLYPGKICLQESGFDCMGCLSIKVRAVGKKLDLGRGEALRIIQARD